MENKPLEHYQQSLRKGKNDMNETKFIEDRVLRDEAVKHYEVLEKVKELLLIPEMDCMTVEQLAEYYSSKDCIVTSDGIRKLYSLHQDELDNDGVCIKSYKDFLSGNKFTLEKSSKGKVLLRHDYMDASSYLIEIPNRGIRIFPRRAILRVGMLLRDSNIAKEVRTQLLNIEEKTEPEVKTKDINEEQKLALELGMSIASGNVEAITIASGKMMAFKNRHIAKLQNDNKALAGEILSWSDRKKLNAGVRQLAAITGIPFGNLWNELYKNLQYKYSICVKQRGGTPYIQWIEEEEWESVIKTFCAMCEAYEQSPTEMFQQTVPTSTLASVK